MAVKVSAGLSDSSNMMFSHSNGGQYIWIEGSNGGERLGDSGWELQIAGGQREEETLRLDDVLKIAASSNKKEKLLHSKSVLKVWLSKTKLLVSY